tara:strand:+ start:1030 stop:1371 length:342 start_codon:yes stop_codon:yes gene_type:complete
MNNTWSSIVQNGVTKDYAQRMTERNDFLSVIGDLYTSFYSRQNTFINDRNISTDIHGNENDYIERKGEKKFFRRRTVSKKKGKNYPTKPKDKSKELRSDITEKSHFIRSIIHG